MELYTRSRNSRYVIDEDFVPKVTIDGEPHEIITIIAGVSGIIAALIVLAILMMVIGCNKSQRSLQTSSSQSSSIDDKLERGDIKSVNLHNNYPAVINVQSFNTIDAKKSVIPKILEEFPQILNCNNLPGTDFATITLSAAANHNPKCTCLKSLNQIDSPFVIA